MGLKLMNDKELQRKAIFEMVKQGRISLKKASSQAEISYRQTLRIYSSYLKKGDAGLIHQSRGQRSNRMHPHREEIIARYRDKYEGIGPTLATEYLQEEGLFVNRETLRQWLLEERLWKRQRKRKLYRHCRERKAQFGELVQLDGSIHDWLGIGKNTCLINTISS